MENPGWNHLRSSPEDLDWGDIIYLNNSSIALSFNNKERLIRIFGSPLTPQHGLSAFQYAREDDVWSGVVPAATDILLVHGPPWGHLDGVKKAGCSSLAKEVARVRPQLVVCGHIHVGYGQEGRMYDTVGKAHEAITGGWGGWERISVMATAVSIGRLLPIKRRRKQDKTMFVNTAIVEDWEDYKVKNEAIIVEL